MSVTQAPETALEDCTSSLERLLQSGTFGSWAQVSVRTETTNFDWAGGTDQSGAPVTTDSLFDGYCLGRLPLLFAVGKWLALGEIDLDQPLYPIHQPTTSVRQLLCHEAGMGIPTMFEWKTQHHRNWRTTRFASKPGEYAYSDVAAGCALAQILSARLNATWEEILHDTLTANDAVGHFMISDRPEHFESALTRVVCHEELTPNGRIPLLHSLQRTMRADTNPACGGMVTAEGLAQVAMGITGMRDLPGGPQALLNAATSGTHLDSRYCIQRRFVGGLDVVERLDDSPDLVGIRLAEGFRGTGWLVLNDHDRTIVAFGCAQLAGSSTDLRRRRQTVIGALRALFHV